MYAQSKNSKQNQSRAVANSIAHRNSDGTRSKEFVDSRPGVASEQMLKHAGHRNESSADLLQRKSSSQVIQCGGIWEWLASLFASNDDPQEEEQVLPGRTTLEGVAAAIDVDPEVLRTQLETGVGEIDVNDIYNAGLYPQEGAITGVVPPTMIENLPATAQGKVDEIFARLNAWPFTYTGNFEHGTSSFLSRSGDCMSLAQMFQLATQAAGIETVEIQHDMVPMLVAQHQIHGRNDDRNLDGAAYWFFHDHHWCVYQGTRYDLLFMANQTPNADHRTQVKQTYNGVSYDLFAGGQALIHAQEFEKLDVDLAEGRMGYAADSENAIKQYIDGHKK